MQVSELGVAIVCILPKVLAMLRSPLKHVSSLSRFLLGRELLPTLEFLSSQALSVSLAP
jgi:hypothetical protein